MSNLVRMEILINGDPDKVSSCIKDISSDAKLGDVKYGGDDMIPDPINFGKFVPPPDNLDEDALYEWKQENWGVICVWSYEGWKDNKIDLESKSGAPIGFLQKMSIMYPDLEFRLWASIEMNYTSYSFTIQNGNVIEHPPKQPTCEWEDPITGELRSGSFDDMMTNYGSYGKCEEV